MDDLVMDFINSDPQTESEQASTAASATVLQFRSQRPAMQKRWLSSAIATASELDALLPIPLDVLIRRSTAKIARFTPHAPKPSPYSLFKTVDAMRDRQGYRLRP